MTLVVFITGMLLLIWSIRIYRATIINWKVLVAPTIVGGIAGVILSWRKFIRFSYPIWATLMIGFVTGSSIVYFSFLYVNERFANNAQITEIFVIEKTGRLAKGRKGCGNPYAVIKFYGL